jgi:hypothetical protein
MNDHDLEEQLRSQRGPREDGYTPMPLPASPEASRRAGPSGLVRAGMFVGAAAAGVVVIAAAAGFFSRSAPGVGSSTPSPSAVPTCKGHEVRLAAEPWGGAAGSRGTVVTVTLDSTASPCALPGPIAAEIYDYRDAVLVTGMPSSAPPSVELEPGVAYTIGIAWSNYCGPDPTPVALLLKVPGDDIPVLVGAPAGAEAVPPCNGQGSPSTLSVTALELKPS